MIHLFSLNPKFTYNFDVDWGDGSPVETVTNASLGFPNISHTYALIGEYDISISEGIMGGFHTIYFDSNGNKEKLLELKQRGTNRWDSFKAYFRECYNFVITAMDEAAANTGNVTDFSYAWENCKSLTSLLLLDVSSGTDFSYTWLGCHLLTFFPMLDVSDGIYFNNAWMGCSSLTSFHLLDVSKGTMFYRAWQNCTSLSVFPAVDFRNMTNGEDAFLGTTLSPESYTSLLIKTAALNSNFEVTFNGGNSTYYPPATPAKAKLLGNGRSITDGGEVPFPAPVADFTADVTSSTAPLTVQFTDTSTNTPTSRGWDFGDDSEHENIQNPSHIYSATGTYSVKDFYRAKISQE